MNNNIAWAGWALMLSAGVAIAVDPATEAAIVHSAIRMNADALAGGMIGITVELRRILIATSFVALFGIGTQGYWGAQGRGFNTTWLTSVLTAVCVLSLATGIAGFFIAEDDTTFNFEAEMKALGDPTRKYQGPTALE